MLCIKYREAKEPGDGRVKSKAKGGEMCKLQSLVIKHNYKCFPVS